LELNRVGELSVAQNWAALRSGATTLGMTFLAIGCLLVIFGVKTSTLLRVVWSAFLIPGCGILFYFGGSQFLGSVQRRILTAEGSPEFRGGSRGPPSLVIGRASVAAPMNAKEALSAGNDTGSTISQRRTSF
jgi:hypothetical protein